MKKMKGLLLLSAIGFMACEKESVELGESSLLDVNTIIVSDVVTEEAESVLDDNDFYIVGEVYNYGVGTGQYYDFGDKKVNYFDPPSFHSLINFDFKHDSKNKSYEELFNHYSDVLHGDLKDFGTLNYLSSHDDGSPFDGIRKKPFETANKLLLSPGTSQVYYGDESARSLAITGTEGDAKLRSFMNWDSISKRKRTKEVLLHWQKLGTFRANHPSIGAGIHQMITELPYVFFRKFSKETFKDIVVVGLDLPIGIKTLNVTTAFNDGDQVYDAYSNQNITVKNGQVIIDSEFNIVLLEKK